MCCLVSPRAFRRYPICCHCSSVRNITLIGALCSHGTKNNQHNSSTQPHSQPRTMSEGAMANSVAVDSAAPARVVATMTTAARAPGTKKSFPVTVVERIWKTKRPYKRQKNKSNVPAPTPQAAAPAKRPRPFLLLLPPTMLWCRHLWGGRSHPPSFQPRPLWRPRPFCLASPSIRAVLSSISEGRR